MEHKAESEPLHGKSSSNGIPPSSSGVVKDTSSRDHKNNRNEKNQDPNVPVLNVDDLTLDNIYILYRQTLLPAIASSLPLLFQKVKQDSTSMSYYYGKKVMNFLIPWTREDFTWHLDLPTPQVHGLGNVTQFLLRNFDSDNDGHISASELLHVKLDAIQDVLHVNMSSMSMPSAAHHLTMPKLSWLHLTSWPLIDYNHGVLLWRSCGGLLLLIIAASIIPGRLHGLSGRILRWPVLALTYLTITWELTMYITVRLFIRLVETIFATGKHRALRSSLEKATSYNEWLEIARDLDRSQMRTEWQTRIDDDSSYRYNWDFIKELIADMKEARSTKNFFQAMVVLQQCTRKNVGGVMNEDLFSYTNSGEPKLIVREFLEEVGETLRWVTKECSIAECIENESGSKNDDGMISPEKIHAVTTKTDSFDANAEVYRHKNIIDHVVDHSHFLLGPVARVVQTVVGGHDCNKSNCNRDTNEKIEEEKIHVVEVSEDKILAMKREQREQVKTFLKRARAAYGRTALCLSGGAMMGCYHFGHVKALVDEGILPHIISGTSAGSVVAAAVCTRTDAEIERDLKPEMLEKKLTCFSKKWPDRMRFVCEHGCLFDQQDWLDLIQWFTCGNMTFEEAYRKTGRILCITLSATTKKAPPVLVNYITAPNVTIASAIVASAAVPGFIKPVILQKKGPDGIVREQAQNKDEAYWDGSIDQDIPTSGLAEMFNCHFFLTAQCNPHIVPFFFNSKGDVGQPSRWKRGHDDAWRGGFLLTALEIHLRSSMKAKMHFLNDLEAALGFTSTMFTQSSYSGTTTIVPQVSVSDYFQLFCNPSLPFLKKCIQVGGVAAFKHCAMMKLHYSVSNTLDECLAIIEEEDGSLSEQRDGSSNFSSTQFYSKGYSLNASAFPADNGSSQLSKTESEYSHDGYEIESTLHDDESAAKGFDGVTMDFDLKTSSQ